MFRVAHAPRHRDIAHDAEHSGNGLAFVGGLRQLTQVIRRPHESVLGLNRPREVRVLVDVLPLGVELQLFVVGGAVGHHLVLAAVVDHRLAVEVLDDRRVARGVGHREMNGRMRGCARTEIDRHDVDRRIGERVDHLVDSGETGQHVVHPAGEGQPRPVVGRSRPEVRFAEVEQVGHQPLLVHAVEHAVNRAAGVGGSGHFDSTVLAGPGQRIDPARAILGAAGRNGVQVGVERVRPVHRPAGDDGVVRSQPGDPTARVGWRCEDQCHQRRDEDDDCPMDCRFRHCCPFC